MRLDVHEGRLAIGRLPADALAPDWAFQPMVPLTSVTRTGDELSIIAPEDAVPADVVAERGWRAMAVHGPLDLALTGVLAGLAASLSEAEIPIFALSTHDTDWLLVPGDRLEDAVATLRAAGHEVGVRETA